jgi:4-hydroxybenzoate polyprenyltransferase
MFGTGTFLMGSTGCTIDDVWDHKLDVQVERIRDRRNEYSLWSVNKGYKLFHCQGPCEFDYLTLFLIS